MIVTCTKCQAKFRVPDEKIGPRGAKVRCSKCQTVFLVRPEGAAAAEASPVAAAAPAPQVEVERPRTIPPPLPPPLPQRPPDPFAEFPAPAPDPPAPDPFAPAAAAPAPDPFAPTAEPDPFAPPAEADPFAPPADPFASPEPVARAADLGDLLAGAASGSAASAAPPAAPAAPAGIAAEATGSGLALEERTASPKPTSSAPFDQGLEAGYDAFAGAIDPQAFDPGALELAGPGEAPPLVDGFVEAPDAADSAPRSPAPAAHASAAALPSADVAAAHLHDRIRRPPSHLRAVLVNAVALAALLVAAVAILALWRTEGPIDAGALRPSAVLAALRRGGGDAPFAAREVRSGLYERERAPPVLFVRGNVVSHATAPVARVRVKVEILRAGAVVARGEALAGALPTPEELWSARDAAALAAVGAAAIARAPAQVSPGDAVPFLVAIADQPADLAGTTLRVEVAPAERASP